ncbi:patatin-like phospholipase family protein [Shouchella shacheensis]|uniref:patatin-like phospholipase family protein n=1 Tax=Shouchella shacheensis TaxID=1649580 RepID=UPI0007405187|nr:patatin-like phospholipase family protein [Shouchella shacheensis]
MNVDAVFAGGGVKAFAFVGAIEVAESKGLKFQRIAGTSAGSIIAAFLMAGYTGKELRELLDELNVEQMKDERFSALPFPVTKWINLYFRQGLYKGDALEEWLKERLAAKGVRTFGDLPEGSLRVVVSDLTQGKMVVLPDDLKSYGIAARNFSVARAIRMSCGIPFFYEPVKLYNKAMSRHPSYIVDGALLSNFPMWLFKDGRRGGWPRPVIGFQLSPQDEVRPKSEMKNAIDMYKAVFGTMTSAHDKRYISEEHAKNIVFIPIKEVKATNFEISEEEKEELILLGSEKTKKFMKTWSL